MPIPKLALAAILYLVPVQDVRQPPTAPPQVYVELVVTACPIVEKPLEPINQGKSYEGETGLGGEARKKYLASIGCIDVPVPPEVMTAELSYNACRSHAGYFDAMQ